MKIKSFATTRAILLFDVFEFSSLVTESSIITQKKSLQRAVCYYIRELIWFMKHRHNKGKH